MIFSRRFSSRLIDHQGCATARVLQSEDLCLPVARITLTVRSRRDSFGQSMPSPPDLSDSENTSLSICKGSPPEVSAGMMLSLIIASDVSKRPEEEGVVRVMKFTLCLTPLVRHAYAFCGFVLAMSPSFDSSFFCSVLLPSRNLSHVSWVPMTEPSTLIPSVICTFDPANVSRARSIFLSSLSLGILGC